MGFVAGISPRDMTLQHVPSCVSTFRADDGVEFEHKL